MQITVRVFNCATNLRALIGNPVRVRTQSYSKVDFSTNLVLDSLELGGAGLRDSGAQPLAKTLEDFGGLSPL